MLSIATIVHSPDQLIENGAVIIPDGHRTVIAVFKNGKHAICTTPLVCSIFGEKFPVMEINGNKTAASALSSVVVVQT